MAGKREVKYPKLPNGYGSIKKLSGNRTNPFAVYLPATELVDLGNKEKRVQPKALAYVDSWLKGMAVLSGYHNGTWQPGQELPEYLDSAKQSDVIQGILSDFNAAKRTKAGESPKMTFKEVYEAYFKWKFEEDGSKTYSASSIWSSKAAYKNFSELHDRSFCDLVHNDFQDRIDNCGLKYSSMTNMVVLIRGMSQYAKIYKITQSNESEYVKVKIANDPEEGDPFHEDDLKLLWKHKDDPTVEMILIMCYSGYRIKAYEKIEVNLVERYFRGGVKNETSKNRFVPIHSGIYDLVEKRLNKDGKILDSADTFRAAMYDALERLGMKKRTPHDCRHTFSKLCEDSDVKENDRKRMMGHSFGSDITNRVYGHRDIEKLRVEIEKIKICSERVPNAPLEMTGTNHT